MEINEYVRTKDGKIGKYIQPDLGKPNITNGISFNEGANYGKHSKDIIDLIEVGDVVVIEQNGDLYKYEVFSVPAFDKQKLYIYESILGKTKMLFLEDVPDEYIVRVLTHEEFDERSYKV